MLPLPHPEVLAAEYVPPTLVGRSREVDAVLGRLAYPTGAGPGARAVSVQGPPGSGSSSVARVAARQLLEAIRRERTGPAPLLATVRVRWCRGTQGVSAALLLHLDEGFHGTGFHVAEIMAGFLRRLARDGRPAVVLLDDIGPSGPDLSAVFRAFAAPTRFLPEGVEDAPPMWVILAGSTAATGPWFQASREGLLRTAAVRIEPYDEATIAAIVRDRVGRAFGREPPARLLERLGRARSSAPSNAARALESVRRELLGHAAVVPGSVYRPRGASAVPWAIEDRVVTALARAAASGSARLSEVRSWEARLAREEGTHPMPATTLWRRLLRLEAEGLVRREVRPGGDGGTRSILTVLRPFTEWPSRPAPGNPPAAASSPAAWGVWGGPGSTAAEPPRIA